MKENLLMAVRYISVMGGTYLFKDNPEVIEAFAGAAMALAGFTWAWYVRVYKGDKK